jgi:transposase-like protein
LVDIGERGECPRDMSNMQRKKYSKEFKLEAVRLLEKREGQTGLDGAPQSALQVATPGS